jgi:hypothetical protein
VPIDVWLVRLRIDVVTDVHTAMLSPAAASANWVETHTLAAVRITGAMSSRGERMREPAVCSTALLGRTV